MTTLTERYIAATLRAVPTSERGEIERELRAAIADALESRGESESRSEIDALRSLGDPARLAASYADRPLHLVGPALYLDYRRVLVTLLAIVVPLVLLGAATAELLGGGVLGSSMAAAASTALIVAAHIAIWTTFVFAVIERTPAMRGLRGRQWDPATLPDLPARRIDLGSVIGGSVVTAVIAALLVIAQSTPPGPIATELWQSGALLIVVGFAVVAVAFDVVGYYVGWGRVHVLANGALTMLFTGAVIAVVLGGALNPEYFAALGWPEGTVVVGWAVIAITVLLGLGNIGSAIRRAAPSKR